MIRNCIVVTFSIKNNQLLLKKLLHTPYKTCQNCGSLYYRNYLSKVISITFLLLANNPIEITSQVTK